MAVTSPFRLYKQNDKLISKLRDRELQIHLEREAFIPLDDVELCL